MLDILVVIAEFVIAGFLLWCCRDYLLLHARNQGRRFYLISGDYVTNLINAQVAKMFHVDKLKTQRVDPNIDLIPEHVLFRQEMADTIANLDDLEVWDGVVEETQEDVPEEPPRKLTREELRRKLRGKINNKRSARNNTMQKSMRVRSDKSDTMYKGFNLDKMIQAQDEVGQGNGSYEERIAELKKVIDNRIQKQKGVNVVK